MALPPAANEAFLREVDEELRRDQLASAWQRWGRAGIGAIVAALLLFGGWLYWQHRREVAAGVEGEQLQAAYDQVSGGQAAAAAPGLATLAGSHRDGYRALAEFTQADVLLQDKNVKGAAAKFAAIAADASLAKPFRDLALVRQTAVEFDTLAPQVVVERLRPLTAAGNPWLGSAGEMTAAAYLKMNRRDLAGPLFGRIARDENVPATIRQRAVQMAGLLGVDAVQANEDKKAS